MVTYPCNDFSGVLLMSMGISLPCSAFLPVKKCKGIVDVMIEAYMPATVIFQPPLPHMIALIPAPPLPRTCKATEVLISRRYFEYHLVSSG